jgi:ribosomal protein S18 acetylase RimI-like enzyme
MIKDNGTKFLIKAVDIQNIDQILPLFCQYQEFYNQKPNQSKNKEFLAKIINQKEAKFFVAYQDTVAVGFSGIYFSYSSVKAEKIAILNDLFVVENIRKQGVATKLLKLSVDFLHQENISHIRWCTQKDNLEAQHFYQNLKANKSDWVHYDLYLSPKYPKKLKFI